ncbi:MAG: hypothetical protein C3F02_03095 [Parcubacteria group bacterium]|nr:MAG: hypothetical protein C3F02_03095 [Parcubacteria group bacterium]
MSQRGSTNISVLTAIIFVAIIFIAGVYVGQEIKNFYRLNEITGQALRIIERSKQETSTGSSLVLSDPTSFMDCVRLGNPVVGADPSTCISAKGELFTGESGNAKAKADLVKLNSIIPYQKISSPMLISGQARGTWFFEGSFPIMITDWDGKIIGQGVAKADGEWMTEDFVPFYVSITFEKPTVYNNGSLILKKDNPSGLPANDDALEIPIVFSRE